MNIQRYSFTFLDGLFEDEFGDFVTYDEAQTEIERLERENIILRAAQRSCQDCVDSIADGELPALRRDAERYRWARRMENREIASDILQHKMNADKSFDNAMQPANLLLKDDH